MKGKMIVLGVVVVGLAIAVAGSWALDVLKPGGMSPAQVVLVRKAGMQANAANYGDVKAKAGASNIKAIAVNARSMMVFGSVLPTLLTDSYADSYPAASKFFFKGGPAGDIADKAQAFVNAAEALASAADKGDGASIDALSASLFGACGACHGAYRGSK